jgi:membrane protein implicated in regulation of membrane protease activity
METLFLACFAFGLLFTLASVVLGAVGGLHFGHVGGSHVAGGHPQGQVHVTASHGQHVHTHGGSHDARSTSLPLLNASSLVGALTWFGAAGYVLLRLADWSPVGVFIGALVAAGVGWYLIARFLQLVLKGEVEMDPADDRLEGTIAQVTVSIPADGSGEVVFTKSDLRRSEAARSLSAAPIPRGTEVVITGYRNGFATVQPWTEFLAEREHIKVAQNSGVIKEA